MFLWMSENKSRDIYNLDIELSFGKIKSQTMKSF